MFVIIGLGLLVAAGVLFFLRQGVLKEIRSIKATDTSTVAELRELSRTIATELGSAGAFKEQVEVKGLIRCSNPLTSQLSQKPCVYAKMRVTEKYEETYYETDDEGNRERKTRQGSSNLADNTLQINFEVEDDTGKIQVNPNGAEIEAIEVVDRYDLHQGRTTLSFGGFSLSLPSQTLGDKRILGHQFNESILPLDTRVYVLGEVSDSDGHLVIQKPTTKEKNERFLITHKSEEQLLQDKENQSRNQNIASLVCLGLGVVCVLIGLIAGG